MPRRLVQATILYLILIALTVLTPCQAHTSVVAVWEEDQHKLVGIQQETGTMIWIIDQQTLADSYNKLNNESSHAARFRSDNNNNSADYERKISHKDTFEILRGEEEDWSHSGQEEEDDDAIVQYQTNSYNFETSYKVYVDYGSGEVLNFGFVGDNVDFTNKSVLVLGLIFSQEMNQLYWCTEMDLIQFKKYSSHQSLSLRNIATVLYSTQNSSWVLFAKVKRTLSWLAPLLTCAFVMSFELGRRRKLSSNKSLKEKSINVQPKTDGNSETTIGSEASSNKSTNNLVQTDAYKEDVSRSRFGDVEVTDEILGYGMNGTTVFEGTFGPERRKVAIKRMLRTHYNSTLIEKEISLLIKSDGHPNVIRYFTQYPEPTNNFIYLILELCDYSLFGVLEELNCCSSTNVDNQKNMRLNCSLHEGMKDMASQMVSGILHLHSLNIIHCDLKPSNILLQLSPEGRKIFTKIKGSATEFSTEELVKKKLFQVKISDMGFGKIIKTQSTMNMTNPTSNPNGGGGGTVGWQAPEVIRKKLGMMRHIPRSHQKAQDIFSLGCIYHLMFFKKHPFGEPLSREANILANRMVSLPVDPENAEFHTIRHLISSMLLPDPMYRANIESVESHPIFWSVNERIIFFCNLSDFLETCTVDSVFLKLESNAMDILGFHWLHSLIETSYQEEIGTKLDLEHTYTVLNTKRKFRHYDFTSIRHCLRFFRNKTHHFDVFEDEFLSLLFPDGMKITENSEKKPVQKEDLLLHFNETFPKLFTHCFQFARSVLNVGINNGEYSFYGPTKVTLKADATTEEEPVIEYFQEVRDEESATTITQVSSELKKIPSIGTLDTSQSVVDPMNTTVEELVIDQEEFVIWEGSELSYKAAVRGWSRCQHEWISKPMIKVMDSSTTVSNNKDPKFRTRLCSHFIESKGTMCHIKKCIFAHHPSLLRVKEGKRKRWGKLVDKRGNCSNVNHSGGEDTFGPAIAIEKERKEAPPNSGNSSGKNSNNHGYRGKQSYRKGGGYSQRSSHKW